MVLTKDSHIRTRQNELVALLKADVAAFVLTTGDLAGQDMADAFVRALPKMKRTLIGQPRPFIARVAPGGSITLLVRGAPRWLRRQVQRKRKDLA